MNFTPYMTPPMYNNGTMQQSMVPNIGYMGGYGYNNGGYYNNMYNQYYNPVLMRQQQEEYENMIRKQQAEQLAMYKILHRRVDRVYHEASDDSEVERRFYEQTNCGEVSKEEIEFIKEVEEYTRVASRVNVNPNYVSRRYIELKNNDAIVAQQYQSRDPLDKSFYDYMQSAGGLYIEARLDNVKKDAKNLTQLYNQNDYSQLLNSHSNSRFNAFDKDFNIDDMEVQLPTHLKTSEYARRKQDFLNSLFSQ